MIFYDSVDVRPQPYLCDLRHSLAFQNFWKIFNNVDMKLSYVSFNSVIKGFLSKKLSITYLHARYLTNPNSEKCFIFCDFYGIFKILLRAILSRASLKKLSIFRFNVLLLDSDKTKYELRDSVIFFFKPSHLCIWFSLESQNPAPN